jgi:hypothetical protein
MLVFCFGGCGLLCGLIFGGGLGCGLFRGSFDEEEVFDGHDEFEVLVVGMDLFDDDAEFGFFMVVLAFDGYFRTEGVADEDGADEAEAIVAIGHGDFVYFVGCLADGDAKDERSVGDASFEGLGLAPFFVHVMGEEITGLAGMNDYVRLCDGAACSAAALPWLKLFVVLLHF